MEHTNGQSNGSNNEVSHKRNSWETVRRNTRSLSCTVPSSVTPKNYQKFPKRSLNGEVSIIDLTGDDVKKSPIPPRRSKSQNLKCDQSRTRRLSKYLAKQRKSIAAMGQDLIGESGIEAARNFLKLSSKSGGQSLGDFSEEDEHHKALSSESLDDGLDYSDTCSTSSTSSAANKIRRGSSARSENRSSLPDITSVNSEEEEEDEEEDEKGDKTQRPIYVNKIEEQKTIPLLNHAGHKSSLSHAEQFDYFCKVILVGDSGVGKTCLLMKYKDGAFLSGSYISTVGIDFRNKVISVDDSKVKLQIWDTAGQERFRSVTHAYYRDAHALLLLYDVSSRTSFDNTREWLAEVHEYAQDDVVIMLIGNKCDIPTSERQIRREDGERLAREYNVAFMETSAKTGINVDLAFTAVARDLKARKSSNALGNKFNVAEYIEKQEKIDHCLCSIF